MQRLFTTFANGWPGKGLLIQRALIAAILAYCLVANITKTAAPAGILMQLLAGISGLLLLLGLWTPIAGVALALVELGIAFSRTGDPWMSGILALFSATLAMIGPGAWSIDARLFGRKHIEISEQ
jgi:putative oxidoreductase